MSRPLKITLVILSTIFGLYLIVGGLLTLILGDKTKNETEYKFIVNNKTADTLYLERLSKDLSENNLITINGKRFLIMPPNSNHIYLLDNVIEDDDKPYEWPINTNLTLIKNKDTLDFIFNDKNQIITQTDKYGNETIIRTIN